MIFADSSGFIAAFDRHDQRHAVAADAWHHLRKNQDVLVTTPLVLEETVTHLRRRSGWKVSEQVGSAILQSSLIEIVYLNEEQLWAAWREFLRLPDPKLSLCDAASFVVMRECGMERALTFDRHFKDAGFDILES